MYGNAGRLECSGIRNNPLDLRHRTFLLKALQISQSFGRFVDRVHNPFMSHSVRERHAYETWSCAHFQYAVPWLKAQSIHPRINQVSPFLLPRIDLRPG